jgi:hypothetical protein
MTTEHVPFSATAWAREHGEHFTYGAALDNYEPVPRSYASGTCHFYSTETVTDGVILEGRDQFREATNAAFLLDDGRTVRPYYVAGWGTREGDTDHVMLHPFPTNFNADGTPHMRSDRDEQVDFGNWMLGPRRCYHLKIRPKTTI